MPNEERAPPDRHATWLALRTFRQRPNVVGRTDRGETIFEVRAVRLLLPSGSSHFARLVQCARCQVDMAGSPVLAADDLDRQPNPFLCAACVRPAPPAPARATDPLQELADRQRALEEKLSDTERRLDALTASVGASASRQHVLEQKLHRCTEQISRLADARAEVMSEPPRRAPGELLEGLERQLRAAEERLAKR